MLEGEATMIYLSSVDLVKAYEYDCMGDIKNGQVIHKGQFGQKFVRVE